MFGKKDNRIETDITITTDAAADYTPPQATPAPLDSGFADPRPDYGILDKAIVSGSGERGPGMAQVVVTMSRSKLTLDCDEAQLAAWALDNLAGTLLAEAKKHKP